MGNGGKSQGSGSSAPNEKQMAAFDRLPPSVRETLRYGYENWAPHTIKYRWDQGKYGNVKELCKDIEGWDKEQKKRDRARLETWLASTQRIGRKSDGRGKTAKHRKGV